MFRALLRTLAEKTTRLSVGVAVTLVGGVAPHSDDPVDALLTFGLAFALAGAVSVLYDTPDVDSRYVSAGLGTVVSLASFAWVWYDSWGAGAGTDGESSTASPGPSARPGERDYSKNAS